MKIAVIGAGNVGGTLGRRWAACGHEVVFGVRDPAAERVRALLESCGGSAHAARPAAAAAKADVIVLAVWWDAIASVLEDLGDVAGKILIDCTNPLDENLRLVHGHSTSGAELIAEMAPAARVVKAFNTVGWEVMQDPSYGGEPATMFFCGGDETAVGLVRTLIADIGFAPCHVGPLESARYLEPLAVLWISEFRLRRPGSDYAFRLIDRQGQPAP
jgi:NADPH-dependent F420 reductase